MRRMNIRRRLSALLACLSLAAVAGCSFSSSNSGGPLPDAKTLVQQSSAVTRNLTSAHLILKVDGKVPGLPVRLLTGDLTTSPSTAAKGHAQISYLGRDISADFVVVDGHLYTNALNPANPAMADLGPASQVYDPSVILSPDTGVANVLAHFTDAKAEGREQVSDKTTVRITGQVSPDAVNEIADPVDPSFSFRATKPVPATVWIVEDGDHQLAQINLQYSPGNSVQMTLSNWGQPVQIAKPAAG